MAGGGKSPKGHKPSIKYKHNPTGGACFELEELDREDYAPKSSVTIQRNGKRTESKSAEILNTADLISAIGQLWDCAILPPVLETKAHSDYDTMNLKKGNMYCYPTKEGHINASTSAEGQHFLANVMSNSHSAPMVRGNLEFPKVKQIISFFEPGSGSHMDFPLWGILKSGSSSPIDSFKDIGHANVGNLYNMRTVHQLLSDITLTSLKHPVNSNMLGKEKNQDCYNTDRMNSTCSNSSDATNRCSARNITVGNADCPTVITKALDPLSGASVKPFMDKQTSVTTTLRSDQILQVVDDLEEIGSVTSNSRPHADCCAKLLAVNTSACEERLHDPTENHLQESDIIQQQVFTEDNSKLKICSSENDKPAFARQEHAFAGAFAGIFVSLCLHPVDTIKTVTQSCRSDQKSILDISRSIISDRGLTGLYRGIASNIASSAPISAIYTFTYESVKGGLLPFLPKEYHSLAHCVAGGSASIATSFIFTPSERIKQQMQVSSRYHSSWNALFGIVKKGGFSSLYAGWGAVLCRNVPHSIIKFYTYERLKQLMLSSLPPNGQNDTLRTLVCGGLAGSTAAFFTTPFDVVKTRLQTQIPGSTDQFDGVFNTLMEIAKHEGLKGLYRGLTPRLVMYMTQGALFFASYESFKMFFSLEAPQGSVTTFQCEPKMKDDLAPFPKTA